MTTRLLPVTPADFVNAGLYAREDDVVRDAPTLLVESQPDMRGRLTVHLYQANQPLTLARAASLARVDIQRMKEILIERGIEPRLGPATIEEAREEVAAMRRWRDVDTH